MRLRLLRNQRKDARDSRCGCERPSGPIHNAIAADPEERRLLDLSRQQARDGDIYPGIEDQGASGEQG